MSGVKRKCDEVDTFCLGCPPPEVIQVPKKLKVSSRAPMPSTRLKDIFGHKIIRLLGSGTYGWVYSVECTEHEKRVLRFDRLAVKICDDKTTSFAGENWCFSNLTHPVAMPCIRRVRVPRRNWYFFMPEANGTLRNALNDDDTIKYIRYHIYCLVSLLKELHEMGITHCDLKPQNILIHPTDPRRIWLCDWGMINFRNKNPVPPPPFKSRSTQNFPEHSPQMVTLWYRPPEILEGSTHYGTETDMWSLGCVMYQYIFKEPPVKKRNERDQLTEFKKLRKGRNWRQKRHEIQKTIGNDGLDLLERLLIVDPDKRITASEAINHRWFSNLNLRLNYRRVKSPFSAIFENTAIHTE